jgi:hypothetical protein
MDRAGCRKHAGKNRRVLRDITENFIMFSTRIRDSPYKKRLSTLEEGSRVR